MSDDGAMTELDQRLANIGRIGKVSAVNVATARARVMFGPELNSDWLAWLAGGMGAARTWRPPAVGDQVLVFAPDGELRNGVILGTLYQASSPAPSQIPTVDRTQYSDGTVVEYDLVAHELRITLAPGGKATFAGDLVVDGSVRATGDVADGVRSMAEERTRNELHYHEVPDGVSGPPHWPPGS